MNIRNRAVTAVLLLLLVLPLSAAPLFNEYISDVGTGPNRIAQGLLPLTFSVSKNARLQILGEEDDKASLNFSMSYGLSQTGDNFNYDRETGVPVNSWLNNGAAHTSSDYYYFNPTGTLSLSLSQKLDDWTYSVSLSSRYSNPQEGLGYSSQAGAQDLTFSVYDSEAGRWTKKYTTKDSVYAYPWLYGKRTNLNNWLSLSASRYIYTFTNLDSFYISLSFEAGPKWMLNTVSNDGITLSDYYRISAYSSQSMTLRDEKQSISLRWLRISLSHSDSLSYTFGSIVPQNKLNTYRLGGSLSDSVTLSFAGPQMFSSDTTLSMSLNYSNTLYFGHFENVKDSLIFGMAYASTLSCAFNVTLFGIVTFNYHIDYYFADGYSGTLGLRGSGEVGMSFNL